MDILSLIVGIAVGASASKFWLAVWAWIKGRFPKAE